MVVFLRVNRNFPSPDLLMSKILCAITSFLDPWTTPVITPYLLSFSLSSLSLSSLLFRRSWFLFSCFSATTLLNTRTVQIILNEKQYSLSKFHLKDFYLLCAPPPRQNWLLLRGSVQIIPQDYYYYFFNLKPISCSFCILGTLYNPTYWAQ